MGGNPEPEAGQPPTLRLVTTADGVALEIGSTSGYQRSKSVPLNGDRAFVELEWRLKSEHELIAMLRVDGLAASVRAEVDAPDFTTVHLGLVPTGDPGPALSLAYDDVRILNDTGLPAPSPILATRDFEAGDVADWTSIVGTNLSVTAQAALSGTYGLEADTSGGGYLLDVAPQRLPHLVSQFRVDLTGYTTSHGDVSTVFAYGDDDAATATTDTDVRLRLYGGAAGEPRLLLTSANAIAPGVTWSPTYGVPKGPTQTVTLQVRTATSGIHPNGYARVWLGDEPILELLDLDNLGKEADWFHFGLYGTDPGTAGRVGLDAFLAAGR